VNRGILIWTILNVGIVVIFAAFVIAIRNVSPLPDPNDPNEVGVLKPTVLRRNLKWASDAANFRVDQGQMTETDAKGKVQESAEVLLKDIRVDKIPDEDLWEYGEVLWTAHEWAKATPVLEKAVKVAKIEDRRINDSLRLAQCYAGQGDVVKALAMARSTLNAGPKDSAPLMPSILFELAPMLKGKGHDAELAKLIEDTVPVYDKTEVDPSTQPGRDFLFARPHLVKKALDLVDELKKSNA
jgi:hypothetical protein